MKRFVLILSTLLLIGFMAGCGGGTKRVALPAGASSDIAVLSLGADTTGLSDDQVDLLQRNLDWMDRNLVQTLNKKGFNSAQIQDEKAFTGAGNSLLLKISITKHKMIPKGARMLGGMMAGADILSVHYDLVDSNGKIVLAWDDSQGSTKGGTYCAQALNRNAADKIAAYVVRK
ncbi:MAG: DUF4410 domain-containing protein [Proteobacteria bacterium]|nr:DUF4410 domain-containing protein [Pseudomonadota bacterium]MBU1709070.1 DUF4410 domain-containing protein [Pseudomonadota bacterium]